MDLRINLEPLARRELSEMKTGEPFFLTENLDIIFSNDDHPIAWHIASENLGFKVPENKQLCVSADGQSILARQKDRLVYPLPDHLSLTPKGLPKMRVSGDLPAGSYVNYDESDWIVIKTHSQKEDPHSVLIFNEKMGHFLKIDEDVNISSHLERYLLLKT